MKVILFGATGMIGQGVLRAINATNGNAAGRKDLESRLLAVLKGDAPRAAKDAVCRRLSTIGTAPAIATTREEPRAARVVGRGQSHHAASPTASAR